ncbi:hypothetical protein SAMD00079811_36680 [Scytonema sp. HK-05]|nr:hypothetical protein SAMD00079811_36680 [Scytonema sp. HK-05]
MLLTTNPIYLENLFRRDIKVKLFFCENASISALDFSVLIIAIADIFPLVITKS